ncbi:MAG: CoA ester lyase [Euryarchaeota archaeon]|nr:CoA ester lyase [Euryarchaeota archaeon]
MKGSLRRSGLYISGIGTRKMVDAGVYGADAVVLDLEASVPQAQKKFSRILVKRALKKVNFYSSEVTVRINPLETFGKRDLREIVQEPLDVVMVPEVSTEESIQKMDSILTEIEEERSISHKISIIPLIEDAAGLLNLERMAGKSERIVALTLDADDYLLSISGERTKSERELMYAKSKIVSVAKAYGFQAIDSVFLDESDDKGLYKESLAAKRMGFDGKRVVNPNHIEIVHKVFTPSGERVERAKKIIKEYKKNPKRKEIHIDGEIVRKAEIEHAKRILRGVERWSL